MLCSYMYKFVKLILILNTVSFFFFFRKSNIVNGLLCEPCSTENNQVLATFFCKTCDDPEPLCDTCANQHTRQKLSRNHKLCDDLKEFQKKVKIASFHVIHIIIESNRCCIHQYFIIFRNGDIVILKVKMILLI